MSLLFFLMCKIVSMTIFFLNEFLKKMTTAQQTCASSTMLRWTVVPEVENRRAE